MLYILQRAMLPLKEIIVNKVNVSAVVSSFSVDEA